MFRKLGLQPKEQGNCAWRCVIDLLRASSHHGKEPRVWLLSGTDDPAQEADQPVRQKRPCTTGGADCLADRSHPDRPRRCPVDDINARIKQSEATIRAMTNAKAKLLKIIPGIGEVFARLIDAEIDDISRFFSPKKRLTAYAGAYAGALASTYSSGGKTGTARSSSGNKVANRRASELPLSGATSMPYDAYLGPALTPANCLRNDLLTRAVAFDFAAVILIECVQGEVRKERLRSIEAAAKDLHALSLLRAETLIQASFGGAV